MKYAIRKLLDEDGSVLTLGIGLVVAAIMFVTVVADVSTLWISRTELNRVADGAALSAVQAVDATYVYQHGLGTSVPLNPSISRSRAVAYVNRHGNATSIGRINIASVTVSGNSVLITLRAVPKLPFSYLLPISLGSITAKSRAQYKLR